MIVGFGMAFDVVDFWVLLVSQVVPDYDAVDFAFVHLGSSFLIYYFNVTQTTPPEQFC